MHQVNIAIINVKHHAAGNDDTNLKKRLHSVKQLKQGQSKKTIQYQYARQTVTEQLHLTAIIRNSSTMHENN